MYNITLKKLHKNHDYKNGASNDILRYFALFLVAYSIIYTFHTKPVYANELGHQLTDVFKTDAFTGSWEVFSKFNWLGKCMNFIISAFSLIGLFLVCYQRFVTMLYLSSRSIFDTVHELKQAGRGQKMLGLFGLFQDNIIRTSNGVGIDGIVSFLLSLLPDVKEYSDFSDKRRQYNINDDDTVTTYMLKIAFPTIMTIFFFTIGFSGTLFQGYATVVSGMAVAADQFVNSNLDDYVTKMINSGSAYQFGFSDDGSNVGKLKQKMAKDTYAKVLKYVSDPTTTAKQAIGTNVDKFIRDNFTSEKISSTLGNDSAGNKKWDSKIDGDEGAKNIMYTVTVNGNREKYSDSDVVKSLAELGSGYTMSSPWGKDSYVHITLQKKANSIEHNYFNVKSNNGNKNNVNKDGANQQAQPNRK